MLCSWRWGLALLVVMAAGCSKCSCSPEAEKRGPIVAAGRPQVPTGPKSPRKDEWLVCKQDTDCVHVPADCCGCRAGGTDMAVAVTALKEAAAARDAQCKDFLCAQIISQHISCSATAKCVEGKCTLEPPRLRTGVGVEPIRLKPTAPEGSPAAAPVKLKPESEPGPPTAAPEGK
ncbi:MAG: hypothetical protein AB2A00_29660 [Myxococcota bacterium]